MAASCCLAAERVAGKDLTFFLQTPFGHRQLHAVLTDALEAAELQTGGTAASTA